jgi:hypothetical protein
LWALQSICAICGSHRRHRRDSSSRGLTLPFRVSDLTDTTLIRLSDPASPIISSGLAVFSVLAIDRNDLHACHTLSSGYAVLQSLEQFTLAHASQLVLLSWAFFPFST